jgi:hypothetical protein
MSELTSRCNGEVVEVGIRIENAICGVKRDGGVLEVPSGALDTRSQSIAPRR